MQKSHKIILDVLSKQPLTKDELVKKTGYSYDGIRGRLSEMRKLGYNITLDESKYILKEKHNIIDYLSKHNLYGSTIDINDVAQQLVIPKDDVIKDISKLFFNKKYKVIQISKDKVAIYNT